MQNCSAIVLAGGRASRLGGANKALLEIGGVRLVDRVLAAIRPLVDQILMVGHLLGDLKLPGVEIVPDRQPGGSALLGIYSGMLAARNPVSLVVACDMPFLSTPLLQRIATLSEGYDITVPRVGAHLEALHAAYRRDCLPVMEEALQAGRHKIIDFYPRVRVQEVAEMELRALDPELRSFFNINTPTDLQRARQLASSEMLSGA